MQFSVQAQDSSAPFIVDRRSALKMAGMMLGSSVLNAQNPPKKQPRSRRAQAKTPVISEPMLGFMLAHEQFPVAELIELGVAAEQAGFGVLCTSDHLQPWQANEAHCGEAWVTMAALGQRTKRAWIGPTVTCPTFRYNPAVVAEAFASLSQLYPGRIFLGIGSGEALNEEAAIGSWPKWQERSERLIEATEIIRQLWKGEQVQHQGKYYNVNAKLYDPPRDTIPMLMAANGPKAMRRAGQYGDGLVSDPDTWQQHKSEFQEAAKAAGKNAAQTPVLVELFVTVGDQKDAQAAAELWRFLPKAFKQYYNVRDPQTIQQRAEAELPLEKVVSNWVVSTDPDAHAKKIAELHSSGATIVNIHSGQQEQRRVIDFYGNEVLPRVKKQRQAA
jgi:TAT-translocated FGD2 family F420-dependent dehydrogenase